MVCALVGTEGKSFLIICWFILSNLWDIITDTYTNSSWQHKGYLEVREAKTERKLKCCTYLDCRGDGISGVLSPLLSPNSILQAGHGSCRNVGSNSSPAIETDSSTLADVLLTGEVSIILCWYVLHNFPSSLQLGLYVLQRFGEEMCSLIFWYPWPYFLVTSVPQTYNFFFTFNRQSTRATLQGTILLSPDSFVHMMDLLRCAAHR